MFFENVNGGIYLSNGARAWARFINNEDHEAAGQWRLDNATLWVAGFKTEKGATGFNVRNNSNLEVLWAVILMNTPASGGVITAP